MLHTDGVPRSTTGHTHLPHCAGRRSAGQQHRAAQSSAGACRSRATAASQEEEGSWEALSRKALNIGAGV